MDAFPTGFTDPITINQKDFAFSKLKEFEYTFDGKIGYVICDRLMLYGFAGVAFNRPSLTVRSLSEALIEVPASVEQNFFMQVDEKSHVKGPWSHLRFGVGGEYMINCNFGFSFLYRYTDYGSLSQSVAGESDLFVDETFIKMDATAKATLKRHIFSTSLAYHF